MPLKPTHEKRSHSESRSRDLVLYVTISLAFMFLAVVLGRSNLSLKVSGQVLSLVLFTGLLYCSFIAFNRQMFRVWTFWLLTIVMISAHLAVFLIINLRVDHWRPLWNGLMFFEIPILDFLKGRFVHMSRNQRPT